MDEKLKHSYTFQSSFSWDYMVEPMHLEFSTDDPIAFEKVRTFINDLMTEAECGQITLNNESKKGKHE